MTSSIRSKDMEQQKEYFAFISYQRGDEKWAKWLQHKLEHYKLPSNLNGRTDLPKEIRPIFKDNSELSPGNLPQQIHAALEQSKNLIVICSPRSARSEWVNKEIETFISMGKTANVIPFIVEGTPYAKNTEEECFPLALRQLPNEQEILGANINEMGRDAAAVKVVARMFDVKFDTLWQRYEREQRKKKLIRNSLLTAFLLGVLGVAAWIWHQNVLLREKDWKMMESQARAVADMANRLVDEGDAFTARLIATEVLPKDLEHPDRPFVPEVEAALRRACESQMAAINLPIGHNAVSVAYSTDANRIAILHRSGDFLSIAGTGVGEHHIIIADVNTGTVIQELEQDTLEIGSEGKYWEHYGEVAFCNEDRYVILGGWPIIRVWDASSGKLVYRIIEEKEIKDSVMFCTPVISVSPDEYYFAVSGFSYVGIKNELRIYEAKTGKLVESYPWNARNISFTPDGKSIIAMLENGEVKECGINSKKVTDLTKIIQDYNFNYYLSGYNMASCVILEDEDDVDDDLLYHDCDFSIHVRNLRNGKISNTLSGHTNALTSLTFSKNGKLLIFASWDKTVKIWNVETGQLLRSIDMNTTPPYKTYCSSDGNKLAVTSENHLDMYSLQEVDNDRTVLGKARKVLFGKNANTLFVSANDSLFHIDLVTGQVKFIYHSPTIEIESEDSLDRIIGHNDLCGGITYFSISPSDKQVATSTYDGYLKIIDVDTREIVQQKNRLGNIRRIQYNKDGKMLMCLTYGKPPVYESNDTLRIWDTTTGELLHIVSSPIICDASFVQDGNTITYLKANDLVVQNLRTGEKRIKENIFENMGASLACSPDGRYLATYSYDNIIRVYDIKTLSQLSTIVNPLDIISRSLDVQFSSDGKYVVAAVEQGVSVWDAETGAKVHHISIPLSTAEEIEAIAVWLSNGNVQRKNYDITDVAFTPDGKGIIWSIEDSIVKISSFPPLQELINETRERFKDRQLTPEERRKYYLE